MDVRIDLLAELADDFSGFGINRIAGRVSKKRRSFRQTKR